MGNIFKFLDPIFFIDIFLISWLSWNIFQELDFCIDISFWALMHVCVKYIFRWVGFVRSKLSDP